ncbi:hypothetical protein HQN87_11085 [Paenibacillus tritici]|uniref:Uncharacterized protein n=1 Tax=Paenibacillus tritici TaxID=1873425 RepID=A0ABX2DMM7_9BACL|nr:hypothetical protein [Paenibacillus tritici]
MYKDDDGEFNEGKSKSRAGYRKDNLLHMNVVYVFFVRVRLFIRQLPDRQSRQLRGVMVQQKHLVVS